MEERERKVEDLERDIAQTVEAQARENAELAERLRHIEEAVKGCLPEGWADPASSPGHAGLVNGLREHVESIHATLA